jgi:hypothetical protein
VKSTDKALIDLLVDGEDGELLNVALNAEHICLQWQRLPIGVLRAMSELLSTTATENQELDIGEIFGVRLQLVVREGIFSFKSAAAGSSTDLFKFDLPSSLARDLIATFDDASEEWEDGDWRRSTTLISDEVGAHRPK